MQTADQMTTSGDDRIETAGKRKLKNGTVNHTVRTADGRYRELKLTRKLAIAVHCTECLGFETDPKDCTSYNCPFFPYREGTRATLRGNLEQPPPRLNILPPSAEETIAA